jgi:CheY-like chemotaxis protein
MIPALSAKTTTLFVDDDASLLRDFCDFLPHSHFFKTFTNPLDALEIIQPQIRLGCSNLESLWRDFLSNKFSEMVSVIVVDHRMEPIDGIEFCKRLGSAPVKRIMLTSHATKDVAIKAFNNNLIDAFLLKTDSDIFNTLSATMEKCTIDFFKDASAGIEGFRRKQNPLSDEDLSKFFFDFCETKNIVSYCCFHDFNNIFLTDNKNNKIFLTIYDNEHVDDLLSSEQAKSAKHQVIDAILKKQSAPCFKNTSSPLIPDGTAWESFMVPLKLVSDDLFIAIG